MKQLFCIFVLLNQYACCIAQAVTDTTAKQEEVAKADDPAQFFSRFELYNELQRHNNTSDLYLNQTVARLVLKVGKRFTTRLDLPFVYNSLDTKNGTKQSGIGDISFRLLGFKFFERPKAALTASMEVSLNTAASPLLGTGKNLLIPVVSYTRSIPKARMITSVVLQQTNSISGDNERATINFTKLQLILLRTWSRRAWTVIAPEWYYDYVKDGLSMNLRSRMTYAPNPRTNIWITPSVGVFGDFIARYQWSLDIGGRYFLKRKMKLHKK